ncbi:unnamed protein product [Darwinula stevensoni]|uniref:Uncharacterized protein n=1 Tax=Darwinula stevensoni TaxID=69355 RepID=A0A7R9A1T0_9CRUS|nr:unnamed protein product [Darwinula stevensoni]CAG0887240.1 unnamed protein product [Darwinula stevensoni]
MTSRLPLIILVSCSVLIFSTYEVETKKGSKGIGKIVGAAVAGGALAKGHHGHRGSASRSTGISAAGIILIILSVCLGGFLLYTFLYYLFEIRPFKKQKQGFNQDENSNVKQPNGDIKSPEDIPLMANEEQVVDISGEESVASHGSTSYSDTSSNKSLHLNCEESQPSSLYPNIKNGYFSSLDMPDTPNMETQPLSMSADMGMEKEKTDEKIILDWLEVPSQGEPQDMKEEEGQESVKFQSEPQNSSMRDQDEEFLISTLTASLLSPLEELTDKSHDSIYIKQQEMENEGKDLDLDLKADSLPTGEQQLGWNAPSESNFQAEELAKDELTEEKVQEGDSLMSTPTFMATSPQSPLEELADKSHDSTFIKQQEMENLGKDFDLDLKADSLPTGEQQLAWNAPSKSNFQAEELAIDNLTEGKIQEDTSHDEKPLEEGSNEVLDNNPSENHILEGGAEGSSVRLDVEEGTKEVVAPSIPADCTEAIVGSGLHHEPGQIGEDLEVGQVQETQATSGEEQLPWTGEGEGPGYDPDNSPHDKSSDSSDDYEEFHRSDTLKLEKKNGKS